METLLVTILMIAAQRSTMILRKESG